MSTPAPWKASSKRYWRKNKRWKEFVSLSAFIVSNPGAIMKRCLVGPGLLAVALLPAMFAVPEARAHTVQAGIANKNDLRQIGIAFHDYHDNHKRFPAAAIYDKDGKPLLSWRVAILPSLDQAALYREFKLDEPWDSPHNIKLLDKMPRIYGPVADAKEDIGKTLYQVFTGPGTVFEGTNGTKIGSISDGLSKTILVAEARDAVPWTKPHELEYKDKEPLPKVGAGKNGFLVLMGDCSVMTFRADFDERQMRNAILRADGNVIDFSLLER
jgi:hypothetical protein